MISLFALWMPILLSAVAVFILSSIIHMVLKYHDSDYKSLPNEAGVMDAIRPFDLKPGEYYFPRAKDMKETGTPEYIEKCNKGPVSFFTILPNGAPNMGPQLIQWFLFSVFVGVFCAYIARLSLPAGAEYLVVSRVTGAVAFCCYAMGALPNSIWYKKSWVSTFKTVLDGLIYGLFTGGIFGWLWPGA